MGFMFCIALLIGIMGLWSLFTFSDTAVKTYEHNVLSIAYIGEAQLHLSRMDRSLRKWSTSADVTSLNTAKNAFITAQLGLKTKLDEVRPRVIREDARKKLAEFDAQFITHAANNARVVAFLEHGDATSVSTATYLIISDEFQQVLFAAETALEGLVKIMQVEALQNKDQEVSRVQNLLWVFVALLVGGLLCGTIFGQMLVTSIQRPLDQLIASVDALAAGKLDTVVPHVGYPNAIGRMAKSVQVLQSGAQVMEQQRWVKQALSEIDIAVQLVTSIKEFGNTLSNHLATMLGLVYVALYEVETDGITLRRIGGYACDDTIHPGRFDMGQGLVGQVAKDIRAIHLSIKDADQIGVAMGFGKLPVESLVISPIVDHGKVLAVLEIGAMNALSSRTLHFIDTLLPFMAFRLQILAGNMATHELLDQTQLQAQELAASAHQLTARRDELESSQLALQEKNALIESSRREIQEIHQHTKDSIEYAAIIQRSILPQTGSLQKNFPESFALWNPKDVVGGDVWFFEALRKEGESLLFVIDCTGHGVPGAFVTMLVKSVQRGFMSLYKDDEIDDVHPGEILSFFNKEIKQLLDQSSRQSQSNAGFDGGVVFLDKNRGIVRYAGAETPLFLVDKNGKCMSIKGARHSVGYRSSDENFIFQEQEFAFGSFERLYLTTDGLLDQNGGEKNFPYGKKRFISLLEAHHKKPIHKVKELVMKDLQKWQGNLDRNDDICFVGIEI